MPEELSNHDPRCMLRTGPAEPECDCRIWRMIDDPLPGEDYRTELTKAQARVTELEAALLEILNAERGDPAWDRAWALLDEGEKQ